MLQWISFVSQTGEEIAQLASLYSQVYEVTVVTNHVDRIKDENKKWFKKIISLPSKPTPSDYFNLNLDQYDLITLNGYLRIIPSQITNIYTIYNGHPGLITKFPELRGKDPQERAWRGEYKEIGSVVHRVIEEVDEGEVLYSSSVMLDLNKVYTLDDYYNILRKTSLDCWDKFINSILC